jgi:hypothetical protein
MLRIALLGLSGLGALVFGSFVAKPEVASQFGWPRLVAGGIAAASFAFGVAAAAALLHRYFSSDGMAMQLRTLRLEKAGRRDDARAEREGQRRTYKLALTSLRIGTVSLAVAGLAFAGALFGVVIR